ncbi:MAG: DNA/RNA nuclease SfsA [Thermoplasmata archaeon]
MQVMDICIDAEGAFVERKNRFLGIVDIHDKNSKVHVRDPGRLEELLYPGNRVLLAKAADPNRKTAWDLIAARYEDEWVLVNSGFHPQIARWVLENEKIDPFGITDGWQGEKTLGNSRIDFFTETEVCELWVEVKGCTLAMGGKALFPDAPTTRGTRHVRELIKIVEKGHRAGLLILVFRSGAKCFSPYQERDPDFAASFREAVDAGVEVRPICFSYENGGLYYKGRLNVC